MLQLFGQICTGHGQGFRVEIMFGMLEKFTLVKWDIFLNSLNDTHLLSS